MTAHLILRGGVPYSVGTVVADPLPDDMTAVALTDPEWDAWRQGLARWDGAKVVTFDPPPHEVTVEEKVAAIEKALVDKSVLTAKDITDAAVAEPVDEVAVVKP